MRPPEMVLPMLGKHRLLDLAVTPGSALACALLMLARWPGAQLLGLGPYWLLIWVVAWSLKRPAWQGGVAGLALGWVQDGLSAASPAHALSLAIVGFLSGRLGQARAFRADAIAVVLVTFAMTGVAETVMALQHGVAHPDRLGELWVRYQVIALVSALLSALWAPAVYYPLDCWWRRVARRAQA